MVSEEKLKDFAKTIVNNEAFPDVIKRIQHTLFERWLKGSDDERKVVGDISDSLGLFITEIQKIYESIDEDKQINEVE